MKIAMKITSGDESIEHSLEINQQELDDHINRLCKRNLKDKRVKCCTHCPFKSIILIRLPELSKLFKKKEQQCQ